MPTAQFMYIVVMLSLCFGFLGYIALKVTAIYALLVSNANSERAKPEP